MARDNSKKLTGIFDTNPTKNKKDVPEKSEEVSKELAAEDKLAKATKASIEKKTMEDTHKRTTFLMDRELIKRLDAIAETQPRGFRTNFFNIAIEELLDRIEK